MCNRRPVRHRTFRTFQRAGRSPHRQNQQLACRATFKGIGYYAPMLQEGPKVYDAQVA